jgi:hypothetical protein
MRTPVPTKTRPVRVWIGYALASYRQTANRAMFHNKLGSIFMPATVQLMQPWGLTAYLPCVLPCDNNPHAPDEVALVFYRSTDAYSAAVTRSVGGRAYLLLHQTLFNLDKTAKPSSQSGFPLYFDGQSFSDPANVNFYLFERNQDWQQGTAYVRVCLYEGDAPDIFRRQIGDWAKALQQAADAEIDVIFSLHDRVLAIWVNAACEVPATWWPTLDAAVRMLVDSICQPIPVPLNAAVEFGGVTVAEGQALNLVFERIMA